jgi:hypothetical protein
VYDYLVAIGLPISVMAFHPLYQPTRFGVARTTGCQPTMAVTMPSFFLGLLHPPVISFFGLLASAYIGWAIIQYRHHVDKLARPCEAFYSARLFLRLCVLVVILAPICACCCTSLSAGLIDPGQALPAPCSSACINFAPSAPIGPVLRQTCGDTVRYGQI